MNCIDKKFMYFEWVVKVWLMFCVLPGADGRLLFLVWQMAPKKSLSRSFLLGLWREPQQMHSGSDTLKKILRQRDRRHAEGVIVKSAFFIPPAHFRNPSSFMLAMALEPGQRKGGRKKRRRGLSSPYAIWFSACLTDFCSFIWPRVTNKSAFPQKYCVYKLTYKPFPVCFQNEHKNSDESNQIVLCLYSSDFANELLCGIHPVSDAFR